MNAVEEGVKEGGMCDTWVSVDRKARNCLYFLPGIAFLAHLISFLADVTQNDITPFRVKRRKSVAGMEQELNDTSLTFVSHVLLLTLVLIALLCFLLVCTSRTPIQARTQSQVAFFLDLFRNERLEIFHDSSAIFHPHSPHCSAVALIVDSIAQFMLPPFYPALALRAHITEEQTALIFSLRGLLATLFTIPCGYLVTCFGHRLVLVFSFLNCTAASCLIAVTASWQPLTGAAALFGISSCAVRVTCFSFVADLFSSQAGGRAAGGRGPRKAFPSEPSEYEMDGIDPEEGERRKEKSATSIQVEGASEVAEDSPTNQVVPRGVGQVSFTGQMGILFGAISVGGVMGPMAGAPIYEYVGAWVPYAIIATLAFVVVFVVLIFPIFPPLVTGFEYNKLSAPPLDGEGEESLPKPTLSIWSIMKTVAMNRKMMAPFVVISTQSFVWAFLEVVIPFFMVVDCGLQTTLLGIAFGLNNLFHAVVACVAAPIVLLLGPRVMVMLGLVVVAIAFPLMVLGKGTISCHMATQFVLNSVVGTGFALLQCPLYPSVVRASGVDKVSNNALMFSLFSLCYACGHFLGQLGVGGLVALSLSPLAIMGIPCGLCLVVSLYWWWAMRD